MQRTGCWAVVSVVLGAGAVKVCLSLGWMARAARLACGIATSLPAAAHQGDTGGPSSSYWVGRAPGPEAHALRIAADLSLVRRRLRRGDAARRLPVLPPVPGVRRGDAAAGRRLLRLL